MTLLRAFQQNDSMEIASWTLSPTDLLFWANIRDPKTDVRQKLEEWQNPTDVSAFVLESHGQVVGYGEIWTESQEVEIARLLIKPSCRRRGFGTELLKEILVKVKNFEGKIWLRVHPDNLHAIALYARSGFIIANEVLQAQFNLHQSVDFIWMEFIS